MSDPLPGSIRFAVVGAGVHGLSTAWHLAMALEARGAGSGADVVVLDRSGPGAGATGVACGCVRNFYMTEALHPILRHSVDVWTYDPITFGFQQVGYVSAGEANQTADLERMHASHRAVGYRSDLYTGKDARRFLKTLWPDFKADGIDCVLHERESGYAGTRQTLAGLVEKCADHGVRIYPGTEVTGYDLTGGRVAALHTSRGDLKVLDAVALCVGPWIERHWNLLGLPGRITCRYPGGEAQEREMWTYWRLREGEVYTDRPYLTADGLNPPVLHVEMLGTEVRDDRGGQPLDQHLYVYFKNGTERTGTPGLQGGTTPVRLGPEAEVDPYGHANDRYQAEPAFADYFCAALGQLMTRFEGCRPSFRDRRNGGIGAFTPDNIPVFDWIKDNCYLIADSNHGFKMTGVGKLVARHLASGAKVAELEPFALGRFEAGRTFGKSNSQSPWV